MLLRLLRNNNELNISTDEEGEGLPCITDIGEKGFFVSFSECSSHPELSIFVSENDVITVE